jgi:hypothetical protein
MKIALRPQFCPVVLVIQSVDMVTKETDDGKITVPQLTGLTPDGITYTVSINQVTAQQLMTLTGSPETDHWTGKKVQVATQTKGERTYFQFTDAPLATPQKPQQLPAGPSKQLPVPLTPTQDAATHKGRQPKGK